MLKLRLLLLPGFTLLVGTFCFQFVCRFKVKSQLTSVQIRISGKSFIVFEEKLSWRKTSLVKRFHLWFNLLTERSVAPGQISWKAHQVRSLVSANSQGAIHMSLPVVCALSARAWRAGRVSKGHCFFPYTKMALSPEPFEGVLFWPFPLSFPFRPVSKDLHKKVLGVLSQFAASNFVTGIRDKESRTTFQSKVDHSKRLFQEKWVIRSYQGFNQ